MPEDSRAVSTVGAPLDVDNDTSPAETDTPVLGGAAWEKMVRMAERLIVSIFSM